MVLFVCARVQNGGLWLLTLEHKKIGNELKNCWFVFQLYSKVGLPWVEAKIRELKKIET